jgi:hypothetical protein
MTADFHTPQKNNKRMKTINGILTPENAFDLSLDQVIRFITSSIANKGDDEIQMAVLGLGELRAMDYLKIVKAMPSNFIIKQYSSLPKAIQSVTDTKIDGINFVPQFNIFKECSFESTEHLADIFNEIGDSLNAPEKFNTYNPNNFEENKEELIEIENELTLLYIEKLPEILATIVLGAQKKPLDRLAAMTETIRKMPAAKILKIEHGFFLSATAMLQIFQVRYSIFLHLKQLAILLSSNTCLGCGNRIYYHLRALIS